MRDGGLCNEGGRVCVMRDGVCDEGWREGV